MTFAFLDRFADRPALYIGAKIGILFTSTLLASLAIFALSGLLQGKEGFAIPISVLFSIPFFVGA